MKKVFCCLLIFFLIVNNLLAVDTVQVKQIYDGVKYYQLKTDEPLSIFLLEIDLSKKVKFELGYANNVIGGSGEQISKMSRQMMAKGYQVVAGVNSDFFGGDPYVAENSMVKSGNVFKGVNIGRSLIGFSKDNTPIISNFRFNGFIQTNDNKIKIDQMNALSDTDKVFLFNKYYSIGVELKKHQSGLMIQPLKDTTNYGLNEYKIVKIFNGELPKFIYSNRSLVILPTEYIKLYDLQEGKQIFVNLSFEPSVNKLYTMIGGLPKIMEAGKPIDDFTGHEGMYNKKFFGKNPRTAIGYNKNDNKMYIVAVDGRSDGYSVGMTLTELSYYMYSLGCNEALNFDGGGSTTLVIRDSVQNKPTDYFGEREVYNGLFLCMDDSLKNIVNKINICLEDNKVSIKDSSYVNISATDKWGFNILIPCENINYEFDENNGIIKGNYYYPQKTGANKIKWKYYNLQGEFTVEVVE